MAVKVNVLPVQIGLGVAVTDVGADGVAGSLKVNGPPNTFDGHPFSVTLMFVYVPAVKPLMVSKPLPFELNVNGPTPVPLRT